MGLGFCHDTAYHTLVLAYRLRRLSQSMNRTKQEMVRLGLCCIFRDQPIKFRTTTATANAKMKRTDALQKLSDLCMSNADALMAALEFCAEHDIGDTPVRTAVKGWIRRIDGASGQVVEFTRT